MLQINFEKRISIKSKVEFNVSFKCFVEDICMKKKQVKAW